MRWIILFLLFTAGCAAPEHQVENSTSENSFFPIIDTPSPAPLSEQYHNGDLIISSGTYYINHSKFILHGNLIVNGTGSLEIADSELHFDQEYNQQFSAHVSQRAVITMNNVKLLTSGKWFNFHYQDHVRVWYKNVYNDDCCIPWHGATGDVKFILEDSRIGLTVNENVQVKADNSSLFFELVLTNVSGTFQLPAGFTSHYVLLIPSNGKTIILNTTNSTFTDWGTTLDKYTNVTFINSKMTIGLNAGSDWENNPHAHVKIAGLKTKHYRDFQVIFDSNTLHLINTFVRDWYPQGWNNATIEIENSDLADVQWNGGTSTIIVRDSTVMIAIAREHVTYHFYDSTIMQDAIAHDKARIYLHHTNVQGEIKQFGQGKVIVE